LTIDWLFLDAGNTLIGLDYRLLLDALAASGFPVDEIRLRRAELDARPHLDRAILRRWKQDGLPRTGWLEREIWKGFWRRVLELAGADSYRADELVEAVLGVIRPASSWSRVEPETLTALDELARRGVRLGVISNSDGSLRGHLDRLGLAGRFEVIVDSGQAGVEKPHPDIFRLALEAAGGAAPTRSLYVGDIYAVDVMGAAGAGWNALLFDPWDRHAPAELPEEAPACRTIRSIADLPSMIRT